MVRLRQFLAFPMYGTAAWLVWVLSLQAGEGALIAALAGAVLIAFALWLWQTSRHARPLGRNLATVATLVALAGAGGLMAMADRAAPGPATAAADDRWTPFDPA